MAVICVSMVPVLKGSLILCYVTINNQLAFIVIYVYQGSYVFDGMLKSIRNQCHSVEF